MHKFMRSLLLIIIVCFGAAHATNHLKHGALDWSQASRRASRSFGKFLWGSATCEYQNSGAGHCKHSNWAGFLKDMPADIRADHAGTAADYWNRCFDDIKLMKELGLNAFRFSIDWSMIEPVAGEFDEEALKHYDDFINALLANNITPMITMYHWVHPQWFEKMGAFESEENIQYFVRFCVRIFNRYRDRVNLWTTLNEPNIYAFSAYVRGVFPPGVRDSLRAGEVLKNLWLAHVAVYRTLKPRGNKKTEIGVIHQHLIFKPFHETSSVERSATDYLTQLISTASFEFLRTGHFKFRSIPAIDMLFFGLRKPKYVSKTIEFDCPDLPATIDFIGLNYYSEVKLNFLKPHQNPHYYDDEIRTDMQYGFCPEGLYNSIVDMSALGVPIYITENGIADADDDRRALWIERHLYALNRARHDGYDVRGYFYWSLLDNLEWDEGFKMRFGLYHVNFDTKERTLRRGSHAFIDAIRASGRASTAV